MTSSAFAGIRRHTWLLARLHQSFDAELMRLGCVVCDRRTEALMSAAREEARTIAAGAGNEAADQEAGLGEAYSIDCERAGAPTTVNFSDGQVPDCA